MSAADDKRASFYAALKPYFDKICDNSPDFGSAGVMLVFYEGQLTRIDLSTSIQKKVRTHFEARHG